MRGARAGDSLRKLIYISLQPVADMFTAISRRGKYTACVVNSLPANDIDR